MFRLEYTDFRWWYWLASAIFLTAGVLGAPIGFQLVIGLTVVQLVHFTLRTRDLSAFPIQVRFAYLLLLLVAYLEPLRLLYWVPTIGTWALVLVGYCPMARIVSLLPWNRTEAFSLGLVKRTFFSPPVRGSFRQHLTASHPAERYT